MCYYSTSSQKVNRKFFTSLFQTSFHSLPSHRAVPVSTDKDFIKFYELLCPKEFYSGMAVDFLVKICYTVSSMYLLGVLP